MWENLDSGGLSTVDSSSVQLSDGGGVLKISSVRTDEVFEFYFLKFLKCMKNVKTKLFLALQVAEGTLPHRSALGFPGLAGGFTFTIYGWSCSSIDSELLISSIRVAL